MKDILLASIICFVLTLGASGQKVCDLTIATSPVVRGLKLGMPEREAAELVRQPFHAPMFDPVYTRVSYSSPRFGGFEGVKLLTLTTFDDKLSRIEITYEIKWKTSAEFVENFTPKLGVPRDAWKVDQFGASMRCKDFDLTLDAELSELKLVDRTAEETIAKSKAEYENDKKKAIKP